MTTEVRGLAPQRPRYKREFVESDDYLLEPSWTGTRALAVLGPSPAFVGYDGDPVDAPRGLLEAIAAVSDCETGVLDGVIVPGFTTEPDLEFDGSGEAYQRRPVARDVYVVVDLLEVDGVSLLEAPLLERKRHLEGVVRPSPNVRLTPYLRRGMRAWRDTLAGQGFKRYVVKKVNSRYAPGQTTDDWLQIEKL